MSPEFGCYKAHLGRAAERTQMSGVGGFFHSASKGVGYDSGPRPDGTRANAAALIIQGLARGAMLEEKQRRLKLVLTFLAQVKL